MRNLWCRFILWLKYIKNIGNSTERCHAQIQELKKIITERTSIHTDVHQDKRVASQVILVGRYRNHDYVNIFAVPHNHFGELVEHLREIEHRYYGRLNRVDAYPTVSATIKNEVRRF